MERSFQRCTNLDGFVDQYFHLGSDSRIGLGRGSNKYHALYNSAD